MILTGLRPGEKVTENIASSRKAGSFCIVRNDGNFSINQAAVKLKANLKSLV